MKNFFKRNYQHLVALAVFLLSSIIYFYPQLQGKVINANDANQFVAMSQEVREYEKETGDVALWTGSMFGGMPTFQLTAPQKKNLLKYVEKVLNLGFDRPVGYFLAGMISFYILLIALGVSPWLSILGALFFAFTTGNMVLTDTGHMTKLKAVFFSPPIIAGMVLIFQNKYKLGGLLFSLFLGLNILANHPQMTYYFGLAMGIFFLMHAVQSIKEKKYADLGKQSLVLLLCCVLALGTSASKLMTTYEYTKSTMRGKPILSETQGGAVSSSNTDGLEWNYAMNWSNGYVDLLPTYIPMAVGGSTQEVLDNNSPLIKKVPNLRNQPIPLYWGGLSSTAGPYFFGAIVFLLFLFGAFAVKGQFKWWLVSAVVFTFLLSLGKNFEILNRLLFDYFPLFNKFRTPNSVLSVTGIFIPILAIVGLREIIVSKDKTKLLKPLYISAGSLIGIALIMVVMGSSLFEFNGNYDSSFGALVDSIKEARIDLLISSSMKTIVFLLIGGLLMFLSIKNKISNSILMVGIGVIAIFDLWVIDKRYLNNEDFASPRTVKQEFELRPVDKQILADPDPHYRVLDIPNFASATPSYHHKTIGGYNPAKLQRIQDIIDRHISQNNQGVLNMLNTKYIIFGDNEGRTQVQQNPDALGNAWFIRNIKTAATPDEEIALIGNINPKTEVIVHQEYNIPAGEDAYNGQGTISLSEYSLNKMTYASSTTTDQLAVFSEVWYQPGWQAYIDGQPQEHFRVNYFLRGMKVPAGNHTIVFEFKPSSYVMGENISLIFSLLILCLGVVLGYKELKPLIKS
jgi:hypothetical protein